MGSGIVVPAAGGYSAGVSQRIAAAKDRIRNGVPPVVGTVFGPVYPVVEGTVRKTGGDAGEVLQMPGGPVLAQFHHLGIAGKAPAQCQECGVRHAEPVVLFVQPGLGGELPAFGERTARGGVLFPRGGEVFLYLLEGFIEIPAAQLLHALLQIEQRQGFAGDAVIVVSDEIGTVERVPHAGNQHVSGAVMVGSKALLGAVAPLPVVAVLPLQQADPHIFQEVGSAPAASGKQPRLRCHRIPLQHHGAHVHAHRGASPHLAQQPVHSPEQRSAFGKLHLSHVPRLVRSEHVHPVQCLGIIGVGHRHHRHPARRPGHHSVGIGCKRMDDHRHLLDIGFVGHESAGPGHRDAEFLERKGEHPGQRIQAGGIYQPVRLCFDRTPSQVPAFVPVQADLGQCRKGNKNSQDN